MKRNQKNILAYVKETKFDCFVVNPDGTRGTHFGGLDPLNLLYRISLTQQIGAKCVITKPGIKYREIYPELECDKATWYSMSDTKFGERIAKHAVKTEQFTDY